MKLTTFYGLYIAESSPHTLRFGDSSTNKFQCTTLLKLESHYHLRALTFLVRREILREAFFLWIRPLPAALSSAGITVFSAFIEFSLFLLSTFASTVLIFVLIADLALTLRTRCFLFCRSRFSADLCVAKSFLLKLYGIIFIPLRFISSQDEFNLQKLRHYVCNI